VHDVSLARGEKSAVGKICVITSCEPNLISDML